jgi:serine/threonine-protein kinase
MVSAQAPGATVTSATGPTSPFTEAAAPPATTVKATAPPLAPATPPRESAKDKKAREGREREARESEARVAAAGRLVAPATGTVKIAISPWGLVEVDGASSGAAPPITELTLAEGRHQIVIRNGDYAPYTTSVNVTAGQTISVRHKFGS